MNRERAKELAHIITALADGKVIETRPIGSLSGFIPDSNPSFSVDWEYRIKPEAREYWMLGDLHLLSLKDAQIERAKGRYEEIIHVREVL